MMFIKVDLHTSVTRRFNTEDSGQSQSLGKHSLAEFRSRFLRSSVFDSNPISRCPYVTQSRNFDFFATIFSVLTNAICVGKMDDEFLTKRVQQYEVLYDFANAKYIDAFYKNEIRKKNSRTCTI